MNKRLLACMPGLVVAIVFLGLSAAAVAEPSEGWGPHYQQCMPQYFNSNFDSMSPPQDAVSRTFERYDKNKLLIWTKEITVWRRACDNNPRYPAIFFKVETIERGPAFDQYAFLWDDLFTSDVEINQNGTRTQPKAFASCSNVSACSGTWVDVTHGPGIRLVPRARNSNVDLAGAFSIKVEQTDGVLNVPDFETGAIPDGMRLDGTLSGSWYEPARSGQGLVLEFARTTSGRMASVYWFTFLEGRQYWLVGSEPYGNSDSSVTFDLYEVEASGFGDAFDPDTVRHRDFGSMSIEFAGCNEAYASWESSIGLGSGDFHLERIAMGLDDVECE